MRDASSGQTRRLQQRRRAIASRTVRKEPGGTQKLHTTFFSGSEENGAS
jgi:hypothetical protein